MAKPIRSGPEFEAAFPVKGKVLQAIVCDCEEEGYLRLRVARHPDKGWSYDPKDASTFLDVHGLDPRDAYRKVRAGEWAEGRVVCFCYLKTVWSKRIEMVGSVLENGTRLVGRSAVADAVTIDFGLFEARLGFEDEATRKKVLKDAGLHDGAFVATDVGVDIELKRWGSKEQILRR
ncbi:MAG: hypothetical protein ACT4OI_11000 [Methanobacteriota archaeon]